MAQFGESKERAKRSRGIASRTGRGLLVALIVLFLAALTWSALFLAPQNWHLRFDVNNAPAWFAAIVSSFSIIAVFLLNRQNTTRMAEQIANRRDRGPKDRGEIATRQMELELEAKTFKKRYGHFAHSGDEIMLICEEVPAKGEKTYSTDEIREQINFLKANPSLRMRVKWAVFVTNENEFVAFQSFDTFLAFVLNEQARPYREALNRRDPDAFRSDFFAMERDEFEKTFTTDEPASDANVRIFGLNINCVEQNWSRQRMIDEMDAKNIDEAMVVGKSKRPVGVVKRIDLVNSIYGAVL